MEELDIEFEQLKELEEEMKPEVDGELEGLSREWVPFRRKVTGRHTGPINIKIIRKLLASKRNLYDIPVATRGEVYRYFEKKMNEIMLKELRSRLKEYQSAVQNLTIAKVRRHSSKRDFFIQINADNFKAKSNIGLINHLGIKVIGCTTTGLSKYRAFLSALQPRTLLIEEAAETVEGTMIGGMIDSLEHLILVGDHQQLQASCNVKALEGPPYNMNVSMFERLVNNSIPYIMLKKQRRMITDIRKLLCIEPKPFYRGLHDHEFVLDRLQNRPPIPGMGGNDTYFFHHTWPELTNADCSRYNHDEAEMIVGFFNYLVLNGVSIEKITVLTVSAPFVHLLCKC